MHTFSGTKLRKNKRGIGIQYNREVKRNPDKNYISDLVNNQASDEQ